MPGINLEAIIKRVEEFMLWMLLGCLAKSVDSGSTPTETDVVEQDDLSWVDPQELPLLNGACRTPVRLRVARVVDGDTIHGKLITEQGDKPQPFENSSDRSGCTGNGLQLTRTTATQLKHGICKQPMGLWVWLTFDGQCRMTLGERLPMCTLALKAGLQRQLLRGGYAKAFAWKTLRVFASYLQLTSPQEQWCWWLDGLWLGLKAVSCLGGHDEVRAEIWTASLCVLRRKSGGSVFSLNPDCTDKTWKALRLGAELEWSGNGVDESEQARATELTERLFEEPGVALVFYRQLQSNRYVVQTPEQSTAFVRSGNQYLWEQELEWCQDGSSLSTIQEQLSGDNPNGVLLTDYPENDERVSFFENSETCWPELAPRITF